VQNKQTWTFACFASSRPTATAGGRSFPFEPLMKGLQPEPEYADFSIIENKPIASLQSSVFRKRGGCSMEGKT
jgi:hypothetical protein